MESAITRAVVQVIATMHHNFREDLTIDGIAHAAGFSRFHLSREFTHLIGVSPDASSERSASRKRSGSSPNPGSTSRRSAT